MKPGAPLNDAPTEGLPVGVAVVVAVCALLVALGMTAPVWSLL